MATRIHLLYSLSNVFSFEEKESTFYGVGGNLINVISCEPRSILWSCRVKEFIKGENDSSHTDLLLRR